MVLDEHGHWLLIKSELIKQEAYFINSDVEISCCYHNYLGVILFRRELISAALKEFEKVLNLQSNNQDAVLCIGKDIYQHQTKYGSYFMTVRF